MFSENHKRELRQKAKYELGIVKNASLSKIINELQKTSEIIIDENNFYLIMDEYVKIKNDKLKQKIIKTKITKTKQREVKNARRRKVVPVPVVHKKIDLDIGVPTSFLDWRNKLMDFAGKKIILSFMVNDDVRETHDYDLRGDAKKVLNNAYWHSHDWRINSDTNLWNGGGGTFIVNIETSTNLPKIKQQFAEGNVNCLLTPIKNWCVEKLENAKGKSSKERYVTLSNKVNKLLDENINGVDQDKLQHIANHLNITISVSMPFQKIPFINATTEKKALTSFNFLNTKHNHVEEIIDLNKKNIMDINQIGAVINNCIDNKIDYYYLKNRTNIVKVFTQGETYELSNDFNTFVNAFEKEYDLSNCYIDALVDVELTRFLNNSCHYNCCIDFRGTNDTTLIEHIDQEACYYNYDQCSFYEGFVGKITDFRKCDKIEKLGIYLITNIVITDEKFKKLNDIMKMYVNNNSYPSPELVFLEEVATFTILGGCWGIDNDINMDFNNEGFSFKSKDNGVPFYSKYVGKCNSIHKDQSYYLTGTAETENIIRQNTSNEVERYGANMFTKDDDEKLCTIKVITKKNKVLHFSQFTSFILAYARLNVIEQLMNMEYDSIVRVNSDGIYYDTVYENDVTYFNNYRIKESECYDNIKNRFTTYSCCDNFCSNIGDFNYSMGENRDFYMTELALGGGGSGKTHFNLHDVGSINKLYLAPSWKLARNKQDEFFGKLRVSTHASLLQCDPTNILIQKSSVIVIDEISMISNEDKIKIIMFYSNHKIIFCGDIKYQLPCIDGPEFTIDSIENVMNFNNDYRASNCIELQKIKKIVRDYIDNGEYLIPASVFNYLQSGDINTYNIEDIILVSNNNRKDIYTAIFTGHFSKEKYSIRKLSNKYSTGQIIITDEIMDKDFGAEIRHGFTVHCVQGETCNHKIFIDPYNMDMRMFYTAISRARNINQIYII